MVAKDVAVPERTIETLGSHPHMLPYESNIDRPVRDAAANLSSIVWRLPDEGDTRATAAARPAGSDLGGRNED